MTTRSSVSADISESVIWINSTDLKSSIKAVKIHEILVKECGYSDGSMLEEGNIGKGISITVCDDSVTIKEMRKDYAYAKKQEQAEPTTDAHKARAQEFLDELYG